MSRSAGDSKARRRAWIERGVWGGLILVVIGLSVDDWTRLSAHTAAIVSDHPDAELRPLETARTTEELVTGLYWASRRVGGFEHVGESRDGAITRVLFLRKSRILGIEDDVTMTIEDRGMVRVVTGTSVSRSEWGDLGRNPKNLRRMLEELRDILDGAASRPAPFTRYGP